MTKVGRKNILKIALHLLVLSVVLALLSPLTAIPSLNFGIWNQSEPPAIFLHGCAALGMLSFVLLVFAERKNAFSRFLFHPLVLIAGGLAVWSMIASVFHTLPALTWFGSPEIGSGVFRFLELAIFIASSLVVMRLKRARLVVFSTASVITVTITGTTLVFMDGGSNTLVPYYFTDYLAFNGICLFAMALTYPFGRFRFIASISISLIAIAIIALSNNRAAILIALLITPLFLGVLWGMGSVWPRLKRRAVMRLAALGVVSSAFVLTALVAALEITGLSSGNSFLANTLGSRSHLLDIVYRALDETPSMFFVGNGWGTYSHLLATYLPTEWATLRDDTATWGGASVNMTVGNWDSIHRVDFHSHNEYVEAFLSVGIIGMGLLIALFAVIPLVSRKRYGFAASGFGFAMASLGALWFLFPPHIPLIATAAAGLTKSSPYGVHRRIKTLFGSLRRRLILGGALCVVFVALAIYNAIFSAQAYYYLPSEPAPASGKELAECSESFEDLGQGGQHLLHRMRTYARFIDNRIKNSHPINGDHIAYFRGFLCASEAYLDKHENIHLAIGTLNVRANIAFLNVPPQLQKLKDAYLASWGARLDLVLSHAPNRTDLAAPYLMWLLASGQDTNFARWAAKLYQRKPNGLIPLWFSGIALLSGDRTSDEGLIRMKRALKEGIERIIPVDPLLKQQLGFEIEAHDPEFSQAVVSIMGSDRELKINVEVADTPQTWKKGLAFRTSLPKQTGMLLLFPQAREMSIWMKDTYISLDILYVNDQGVITHIVEGTEPRNVSPLPEIKGIKAVLEIVAGSTAKFGIEVGDRLRIDLTR